MSRSASRFGWGFIVMLVVAAGIAGHAIAADAITAANVSTEQLRYTVYHSIFGNIGTYTNDVQRSGDTTIVRTTAHFVVRVLGIAVRRENDQRVERWLDGRLVSFVGVTRKNADATELRGEAEGNEFVINSPLGTVIAPASVQPANPWSARCLRSTIMMRVDDGEIEKVRVTGGSVDDIVLDGRVIPTRMYDIEGKTRYRLWFDRHNVPVKFVVDDSTGKITFTLMR